MKKPPPKPKSVIKFMAEFTKNWQRTGALFPASRKVAIEMTACIPEADGRTPPRRILEVGAGTGAITAEILPKLSERDTLVIYELSPEFAQILTQRIAHELDWQGKNIELRIAAFPDLLEGEQYDYAICALPFNNFSSTLVKRSLDVFAKALAGGGHLAFYEYCLVRKVKMSVTGMRDFVRLKRIDRVMEKYLRAHRVSKKTVRLNIPPAWVHLLQFK